jgi:hypothetical protein
MYSVFLSILGLVARVRIRVGLLRPHLLGFVLSMLLSIDILLVHLGL